MNSASCLNLNISRMLYATAAINSIQQPLCMLHCLVPRCLLSNTLQAPEQS
jgi:hypothetical protein